MPAFPSDFTMFVSEFSGAPLSTTVAALTVLAFLFQPVRKAVNGIFKYKRPQRRVKECRVPLHFELLCHLHPIEKLPSTGRPEKLITLLFSAILDGLCGILSHRLCKRLPPRQTRHC